MSTSNLCSRCGSFTDFPQKEIPAAGSGLGEQDYSMTVITPTPDVEAPVLHEQNINQTKHKNKRNKPLSSTVTKSILFCLLTSQPPYPSLYQTPPELFVSLLYTENVQTLYSTIAAVPFGRLRPSNKGNCTAWPTSGYDSPFKKCDCYS